MDIPAEDNTMVLKLMGEFESSLANKFEKNRKDQQAREKLSSRYTDMARIARLENELSLLKSSNKRSRVMMEQGEEPKKKPEEDEEAQEELKKQVTFLVNQLEKQKQAMKEATDAKSIMRNQYEEQLKDIRHKKLKTETALQDLQISSRSKMSSLINDISRKDSEKQILQTELEEMKERLKREMRKGVDSRTNKRMLEEYKAELNNSTQRIKELEMQLMEQEDSYAIAKAVRADVKRLAALEVRNKELEKENEYFRETTENNYLLKEKVTSLESKLSRSEETLAECARLQVENKELEEKLKRWETVDTGTSEIFSSPSSMARRLVELQQSQVEMLARQGEVMTSSHIHEEAYGVTEQKLRTTTNDMLRYQEQSKRQQENIRKLQRKVLHLSKERDCIRNLLDSYDNDITSNSTQDQSRQRMKLAEENLVHCQKQMEALEKEAVTAQEEGDKAKLRALQVEAELSQVKDELLVLRRVNETLSEPPTINAPGNQEEMEQMKKQLEDLETEKKRLTERNEYLELYMEQRNMKGDYDPSKTKVISFSMNPAAVIRQQREKDLKEMKEECEALRERVKVLEEVVGDENTQQIAAQIKLKNSQVLEDLKKELDSSKLREQRLKEVFKKKIHEFREAFYRLTGYLIHNPSENQYKLQSMYAENEEDVLLFRSTSEGDMQLLENEFSSTLQVYIDMHLKQQDSIPAFLSSVTLDLFSRQTMATQTLICD